MNKTKLEVIRINEDVITTSGVCQHQDEFHVLITDYHLQNEFTTIWYNCTAKKYVADAYINRSIFPAGAQPSNSIYYYWDGSSYKICEGSHDFSSYTTDN